jgi:hypothetical protein
MMNRKSNEGILERIEKKEENGNREREITINECRSCKK